VYVYVCVFMCVCMCVCVCVCVHGRARTCLLTFISAVKTHLFTYPDFQACFEKLSYATPHAWTAHSSPQKMLRVTEGAWTCVRFKIAGQAYSGA